MEFEKNFFSYDRVAELFGVNASSIHRWVDSGKLKCTELQNGERIFSETHLIEFAITYNISMKCLETMNLEKTVQRTKKIAAVSSVR